MVYQTVGAGNELKAYMSDVFHKQVAGGTLIEAIQLVDSVKQEFQ